MLKYTLRYAKSVVLFLGGKITKLVKPQPTQRIEECLFRFPPSAVEIIDASAKNIPILWTFHSINDQLNNKLFPGWKHYPLFDTFQN